MTFNHADNTSHLLSPDVAALLQHMPGQSKHSDLQPGISEDLLWSVDDTTINGKCRACWSQEELIDRKSFDLEKSTGLEYLKIKVEEGSKSRRLDDVGKAENTKKNATEIHNDARESEEDEEGGELLIVNNGNAKKLEEDTCGTVLLVELLKSCAEKKDLVRGSRIHATARNRGFLEKNVFVGSAVVSMYAKCGALAKAKEAFNELGVQNVVSWNALIAGYVQHKHGEEAWNCFMQMPHEGIPPDGVTFSCILKACGSIGASERGQIVHAQVVRKGLLEKSTIIGNALIDMYLKCSMICKAGEVFEELPSRDVVSWTALITGYAVHGYGEKAVNCFERMQREGGSPNAATFLGMLKACSTTRAACKGQEIHAEIINDSLFEGDIVVGTALVDMYAKCGMLTEAQDVFDELPVQDAVLWSTLIDGYAQNMQGQEAVNCFEQMQLKGFSPDEVTFACVLKACGNLGAADKGRELHNQIVRDEVIKSDAVVGNALVAMYAKSGLLKKAEEVFDQLAIRDVISWNALLGGYVQHGCTEEALTFFQRMQCEGPSADSVTFACVFKACASIGAMEKGQEMHAKVLRECSVGSDLVIGNALVDMYAKHGMLDKAQGIFDELEVRDVTSWNALIQGHTQSVHAEDALTCFDKMQMEGLSPDAVTFTTTLKACASIGAADKGQEIQDQIIKEGMWQKSIVVSNSLIDMYAKCGLLQKAQDVFDTLTAPDIVSWNTLMAGYVQHGHAEKALECFGQMQAGSTAPNYNTYISILKACGSLGTAERGQAIHAQICKCDSLEQDVVIGTALVDMYAKCGVLGRAQEVFDKMPDRDIVAWNALVSGYIQAGYGEKALDCYKLLQLAGISPDTITFICLFKACSSLGALCKGREMHAETIKRGWLEKEMVIGTMVVDMYASCGMPAEGQDVFDKLSDPDVFIWNSLISGYALLGEDEPVCKLFHKMNAKRLQPDLVTFTIVLNTCSHGGLLDGGKIWFELMTLGYCMNPVSQHCTCIVDLFARAGQVEKAVALVNVMAVGVDVSMLRALMGACLNTRNMELGTWASKHATQIDEADTAAYVSIGNMCADAERLAKWNGMEMGT